MRITMKTLSASPAGALEAGKTYDLPRARALPLLEGGYAVLAGADPAQRPVRPDRPAGAGEVDQDKPLDKRTVDQLKAFAAEHEIDLGEATRKADILAAIHDAVEEGGLDAQSD